MLSFARRSWNEEKDFLQHFLRFVRNEPTETNNTLYRLKAARMKSEIYWKSRSANVLHEIQYT